MTVTFTAALYDGDIEVGRETFQTFKEARSRGERHNFGYCDRGDFASHDGPSYNITDADGHYW